MKTLLNFRSRLLAVIVALICGASLSAQDYKALQMGEVFTVKNFGDDIWTITPTESGLMKIVGDNGDGDWIGACLVVYTDAEMTTEVHIYTGSWYEITVEANHTYYIRNWNWTGQDYKAHCTMGGAFAFLGSDPAEGEKLAITSNSVAQLNFTRSSVSFNEGEITANGNVIKVYQFTDYNDLVKAGIFTYTQEGMSGVVNWNGNICARSERGIVVDFTTATGHGYYNVIHRLYEEGKLEAGDQITLTMHGVRDALTNEMLNGDGELTINWVFAGAPTVLVSQNVPSTILSWYNPDDPAAVATFTFSRDIQFARASLEMGQGEGYDDLYNEEIAADHISYNGATVSVDLSGVMRTQETMGLKNKWQAFTLTLFEVRDTDGNGAYSEGLGSASSYSFTTAYKDITAKLSYEITPATGANLTANSKSVEIWFDRNDLIEYDGVDITYYLNGEQQSTFVAKADLKITVGSDGTTIICPLPADIYKASNVCVKLNITKSVDGMPHVIAAYYNTSLLYELDIQQVAEPASGSTVHRLSEIYLPLGYVYSINNKISNAVTVTSKTDRQFSCGGKIVADGMVQAKIVLDEPITAAGSYTVTIKQGAIGDYVYGESSFKSGTASAEAILEYEVSGLWNGRDVVASPDNDETVSMLKDIKLTFFNYSSVSPTWNNNKAAYVEDESGKHYEGDFVPKEVYNNEIVFSLNSPITTPGQYCFVLTAGSLANGATGDPIATEYTFNYTVEAGVVAEKPTVDPAEGTYDEIGDILIDFGQPVTVIEASDENNWWVPQPQLQSTDGGWTLSASGQLEATDNPNVVKWVNWAGTAVAACDAVFNIPADCVQFADGTTNAEYTYNYTITGANDINLNIISSTPELWSTVDELSEMTVTFDQPVTVGEWPSVTANDAFWTQQAYGTIVATDDPATVKIVFDEPIKDFGETSISISAYSLMVNGKPYDKDIYLTVTIGENNGGGGGNNDPVENENIEITPAAFAEVASLRYFEITFGGYEGAWNEEPITLTDQFDNVIATVNAYGMLGVNESGVGFWELGKPNTYSITLPQAITTPGYYYLNIPAVCEKPDGNTVLRELCYMYEIVESTPDNIAEISSTVANGKAYSITGAQLKNSNLPTGIYIINGKKVVVRK